MDHKPILCLDFDGVLHRYSSGWQGVTVIPDGPVPGATAFLRAAVKHFDVCVYSSRSKNPEGRDAMRAAVSGWLRDDQEPGGCDIVAMMRFVPDKPAAFLTIDDRALCFDGTFPDAASLLSFTPWNKEEPDDHRSDS